MPSVEIYTMSYCPYCIAAKRLLKKLGWQFNEIEITGKPKVKTTMVQRTQRKTVPQIFLMISISEGLMTFQLIFKNISYFR